MDGEDESHDFVSNHRLGEPETSGEVESGHRLDGFDALAKTISLSLGSVMKEFDSRAEGSIRGQGELTGSIDRLTRELDKLLEDAPLPFIMQHAMKISSIRRRLSSLNLILKSIQRRIDNVDRIISTGVPTEKVPPDVVAASSLTL